MPADDDVPYRREKDFLRAFLANAARTSTTMVTGDQGKRRRQGKPYAEISGNQLARLATDNMRAVGRLIHSTAGSWSVRQFVGQAIDLIHRGLRTKPLLKALRTHETGTDYGVSPEQVPELWRAFQSQLQEGMQSGVDARRLAAMCEYQVRFVIHPYGDGSGRLATALAAWVMLSHGQKIPNYNFCDRKQLHAALRLGFENFAHYYVNTFFPSQERGRANGSGTPQGMLHAM